MRCHTTHYAGCVCQEERLARAEAARDALMATLREILEIDAEDCPEDYAWGSFAFGLEKRGRIAAKARAALENT